MERLELFFGSIPLQKVGTFNLQSEEKIADLYVAKLARPKNTDVSVAMMFVTHSDSNPGIARLTDLAWNSFMVRSYPHVKAFHAALKKINVKGGVGSLKPVKISKPNWGAIEDIVLTAQDRTDNYTIYSAPNLNMKVTGFVENGQRGNDFENQVELIPILESFNFCVQK